MSLVLITSVFGFVGSQFPFIESSFIRWRRLHIHASGFLPTIFRAGSTGLRTDSSHRSVFGVGSNVIWLSIGVLRISRPELSAGPGILQVSC
jgi:hypothetical protein